MTNSESTLIAEIAKAIFKADDIALYCHTNPDGDALGSMLALRIALKNRDKSVSCYCDCPVPEKYKTMLGSEDVCMPDGRIHELAISLDSGSLDRLGQCVKSFLSAKRQIVIDHHKSFKRYAELCLIDENAAANAQIVYKLLKYMKALDADSAKLLFGGIVTDSGCFAYSSVTAQTHEIAGELMKYDFNAADTIYNVFRSTSLKRFDLKVQALSKAKFFNDAQIAFIIFDSALFSKTGTDGSDTEGIVSELIDIETVKIAFALSEVSPRNYKVSVRTKDGVDASQIAAYLGGGGHPCAAGCRANGYLEDIEEKLLKIARDFLNL